MPTARATPSARGALRFGGTGTDTVEAIAVDTTGATVAVGTFTGTMGIGGGALVTAGSSDAYVAKYDAGAGFAWAFRLGGVSLDAARAVAIDTRPDCDGFGGTNCVVVAGIFHGAIDLDASTSGTMVVTSAGAGDDFLAKYTSDGGFLWGLRFGSANASVDDPLGGIAVGPDGRIVVIGSFYGSMATGALAGPAANILSPFVLRFDPDGTLLWGKTFANNSEGLGRAIAVNAAGDALAITGSFQGSMNFGNGTKSSFGAEDIFVAQLRASDGGGTWSSRFGGAGQDIGYAITFDRAGFVTVGGTFASNEGVSFGGERWVPNGADAFLASFTGSGTPRWSRRCTGAYTFYRRAKAVATDRTGTVTMVGHAVGAYGCGADTATLPGIGAADVVVSRVAPDGGPLETRRLGAANQTDVGMTVALDPTTDMLVYAGQFQGALTAEGQAMTSAGGDDVFVAHVLPGALPTPLPTARATASATATWVPTPTAPVAPTLHAVDPL